jgi:leishmanolysin
MAGISSAIGLAAILQLVRGIQSDQSGGMLVGAIIASALAHEGFCVHDSDPAANVFFVPPEVQGSFRQNAAARQPIRIRANFDSFSNIRRSDVCTYDGETVTLGGTTPYVCESGDVMTAAKRAVVEQTFASAVVWFPQFLEVDVLATSESLNMSWTPQTWAPDLPLPPGVTDVGVDHDLLIFVIPRVFDKTGAIASAATFQYGRSVSGRPIAARVFVGVRHIPRTMGDVFSPGESRNYFRVIVHEIFHTLGFSKNAMALWRNETGFAYGNSLPLYEFAHPSYPNKIIRVLSTPKVHAVLTARWGVKYFFNIPAWPMGAELEDNGNAGTVGSHLEGRVFNTEVMTGWSSLGHGQVSIVSLAVLEDTGWYNANYSWAESLDWGDWRSIDGASRADFANFPQGEPQLHWPLHYVAQTAAEATSRRCTFDHRAKGLPASRGQRQCGARRDLECQNPGFYDARQTGHFGPIFTDWALVTTASEECQGVGVDSAAYGEVFGGNSWCVMSQLSSGNASVLLWAEPRCMLTRCQKGAVYVTVGGVEKACMNATQSWDGYGGAVTCPNASILCPLAGAERPAPTAQVSSSPISSTAPASASRSRISGWRVVAAVIICVAVPLVGWWKLTSYLRELGQTGRGGKRVTCCCYSRRWVLKQNSLRDETVAVALSLVSNALFFAGLCISVLVWSWPASPIWLAVAAFALAIHIFAGTRLIGTKA